MRIILMLTFISIFLLFSCNKHDCPEGYECIDDTCVCPDDKFEGLGMCKSLAENEYFGTVDCIFQDTIFVTFLEREENRYKIQFDNNNSFTTSYIQYIEMMGYDSLYYNNNDGITGSGFLGQRIHDENCCLYASIFGRLTSDNFTGRIEWRENKESILIESCPFEMTR